MNFHMKSTKWTRGSLKPVIAQLVLNLTFNLILIEKVRLYVKSVKIQISADSILYGANWFFFLFS
jgi:hypothetical protein